MGSSAGLPESAPWLGNDAPQPTTSPAREEQDTCRGRLNIPMSLAPGGRVLSEAQQDDTDRVVGLLEARGPQLGFPYSSGIAGSQHAHMRELRVQSGGHPPGSFMPLIRAARLFCSSVATRLATTASMTPISPSRIGSAMPISQNSDVKDGSHEWTSPV